MTTSEDKKPSNGPDFGPMRTFGRTGGRPLSQRQQRLMDEMLPKIAVDIANQQDDFDPNALFTSEYDTYWFEIGFGGAEHLIGQAKNNPNVGFIGAEPFLEGVAKALVQIEETQVENVRLHADDARQVLKKLSDNSLDRVFIMFPDPWHKARHHKRRIIQQDFLKTLSRVLKPQGQIRFATDWENYAEWTLEQFQESNDFKWTADNIKDCTTPPKDHVTTRYQVKGLGDCAPIYLDFVKV